MVRFNLVVAVLAFLRHVFANSIKPLMRAPAVPTRMKNPARGGAPGHPWLWLLFFFF